MSFASTAAKSIRRSIFSSPWHGPSLQELIDDVTVAEAGAKPFGAHSILELVLHLAVWVEETASRLDGHPPVVPAAGDWPEPSGDSEQAWAHARDWLMRAGLVLTSATAAFPEERLEERVGTQPDAPSGSDITFGTMLIGIAEHNAYHAGQIALLKRAIRAR